MKKFFVVLLVIAVPAIYFWPQSGTETIERVAHPASQRATLSGPVIGFEDEHNTYGWLGIPFAAAPVRELRWRAPRAAAHWLAPREATAFSNACVQLWGPLAGMPGEEGELVGDEDCLYLNVWSPRELSDEGAGLPVMVWIHGGGNTIGTANTYNGSVLAGGENVVLVTVNYRLGFFGWMSHPALRGEGVSPADASGNYGTLDLVAALEWVQGNIANFGGDPGNVTIFGESAGGRNVFTLMSSPMAGGLFHRAIAQSGSVANTPLWRAENYSDDVRPGMELSSREWLLGQLQAADRAEHRSAAKPLLDNMPASELLQFMRSRSAAQVMEGVSGMAGMYRAPQTFRDGAVLPAESQLSRFRSPGEYNAVPLMTGTTRDEVKLFMAQSPHWVKQRFGFLPRIRDIDAYNRAAAYGSDQWKANSVDEVAAVISSHGGQPVYAYRWDWDEGGESFLVNYAELIGAGHGMEVPFVFGSFNGTLTLPGFYNEHNSAGRDELSRQMRSYWSEFARSGDPGNGREGDLPRWQAWREGDDNLMLLDTGAGGGLRMVQEPMTVAMLKMRVASDPQLQREERCNLFAVMFFQANAGDDFWDQDEYRELGCADMDPWAAEIQR